MRMRAPLGEAHAVAGDEVLLQETREEVGVQRPQQHLQEWHEGKGARPGGSHGGITHTGVVQAHAGVYVRSPRFGMTARGFHEAGALVPMAAEPDAQARNTAADILLKKECVSCLWCLKSLGVLQGPRLYGWRARN